MLDLYEWVVKNPSAFPNNLAFIQSRILPAFDVRIVMKALWRHVQETDPQTSRETFKVFENKVWDVWVNAKRATVEAEELRGTLFCPGLLTQCVHAALIPLASSE